MTPAEKYRFDPQTLETLEHLSVPFAVYQFLDKRVVTLALSDGFCRLFGYEDRAQAADPVPADHGVRGGRIGAAFSQKIAGKRRARKVGIKEHLVLPVVKQQRRCSEKCDFPQK